MENHSNMPQKNRERYFDTTDDTQSYGAARIFFLTAQKYVKFLNSANCLVIPLLSDYYCGVLFIFLRI
jgi:hypothetical protein